MTMVEILVGIQHHWFYLAALVFFAWYPIEIVGRPIFRAQTRLWNRVTTATSMSAICCMTSARPCAAEPSASS